MTQEQWLEHEVRIRVHDDMFMRADERLRKMESKLNWIITLVISGILLPVILHAMDLV